MHVWLLSGGLKFYNLLIKLITVETHLSIIVTASRRHLLSGTAS